MRCAWLERADGVGERQALAERGGGGGGGVEAYKHRGYAGGKAIGTEGCLEVDTAATSFQCCLPVVGVDCACMWWTLNTRLALDSHAAPRFGSPGDVCLLRVRVRVRVLLSAAVCLCLCLLFARVLCCAVLCCAASARRRQGRPASALHGAGLRSAPSSRTSGMSSAHQQQQHQLDCKPALLFDLCGGPPARPTWVPWW